MDRFIRFMKKLRDSQAGTYLISFAFLLLAPSILVPLQCQTRGCSPYPSLLFSNDPPLSPSTHMAAQGQEAFIWMEFGDTGVFSPTTTAEGTTITMEGGQTIPFLDDLAQQGYIAIRVPHAPPTYTESSILPGVSDYGENDAVLFSYYSPPSSEELTTVAISVTRRADLEAIMNTKFATAADNQSHWEVWWLPPGEKFPLPNQPFRLDAESWPPPLGLRFRIDFVDADAEACAGCPVEVLANNGYLSIGPYKTSLRYINPGATGPLVSFGSHCTFQDTPVYPTVGQYITPTVPFTHAHCLESWDTMTRTFTIAASSSQGWDYTYYWQGTEAGAMPQPAGNPPFTVEIGPIPNPGEPGTLGLLAVYTPTIAVTDTLRETFFITATSTISPEVQASTLSFALAPGYTLNESSKHYIYLPLILK